MEYENLTGKDINALRAERITLLEGEHFRLALRREEAVEVAEFEALSAQMVELERRIGLHRGQGAPVLSESESADVQA
jgi:hypothetical protein